MKTREKSGLRSLLVAANGLLGLIALALAALLLWNHFRGPVAAGAAASAEAAPVGNGSAADDTVAPLGNAPAGDAAAPFENAPPDDVAAAPVTSGLYGPGDVVPKDLTFSFQYSYDCPVRYIDGKYYIMADDVIRIWQPGDGNLQVLFDMKDMDVDEVAHEAIRAGYIRDICVIDDMVYICAAQQVDSSFFSVLLCAPLEGGRAEYLFTLPYCTMTAADGILYLLASDSLLVYEPAKGGTPEIHLLGTAAYGYEPFVFGTDVYFDGGEGLCRYNIAERQLYTVMGVYGTPFSNQGGTMVNGVFYYQYYNEEEIAFLCAYDTHTGIANILDGRYGEGMERIKDTFTGYSDGGIYYAADNNANYRRYDIASGSISEAYTVETVADVNSGWWYPPWLEVAVGNYFYSEVEYTLIDPATGKVVEEAPRDISDGSLIDPIDLIEVFKQTAARGYEYGTLVMPDGSIYPLTEDNEATD